MAGATTGSHQPHPFQRWGGSVGTHDVHRGCGCGTTGVRALVIGPRRQVTDIAYRDSRQYFRAPAGRAR